MRLLHLQLTAYFLSCAVGLDHAEDQAQAWTHHTAPRHAPLPPLEGSKAVIDALELLIPLAKDATPLTSDHHTSISTSITTYAQQIFNLLFRNGPMVSLTGRSKLAGQLSRALTILENAANEVEPDVSAISLLAEMTFYGNFTCPQNYTSSFHWYEKLVKLNGDKTAHHMLGFMYATGLFDVVERDQALALTHHTFAALAGDTRSQMTLAFRHHTGIAAVRNCDEAAKWYKKVADKAIRYMREGPPGGQFLQRESFRVSDDDGGVYGEGASVVSSGKFANRGGVNSDTHSSFDDVLEYLDLMSRKGDLKATYNLGKLHYEGSRKMRRNVRTARTYFMIVARRYWQKDGTIREEDQLLERFASKSAGYIGRMFLRGEGMEQDFSKAEIWFRRGLRNGDAGCQYHLGLMYLKGYGIRQDVAMAADYFKAASDQDIAPAQVMLGQLFLDQGSVSDAVNYFELGARHGNVEALYHLAEISNNGVGRDRSCGLASAYYKLVAEKVEPLHAAFDEANRLHQEGSSKAALALYAMAAEQGYESAQANVGFLLDDVRSMLAMNLGLKRQKAQNALLALIYWTRSAKQSNVDSMVKMGDYYFGGYGVEADLERAAACYQTAADTHHSAQALWNLGWIHENGYGVEQDFHLAKRFYDQALETAQESYLPVQLALVKLRIRSFWNTLTRGKANSIIPEPAQVKKNWSFSKWFNSFIEAQYQSYHDGAADEVVPGDTGYYDDRPVDDGDYYDDLEENLIETLVILALAGALAFLVYYRNQRQQDHRRLEERTRNEQTMPAPDNDTVGEAQAITSDARPYADATDGGATTTGSAARTSIIPTPVD